VKYVTTKISYFVERALLFIYESVYSKETLRAYFKDEDWFDDDYIESERRKKNEVAYNNKSKFQPYRCPSCNKPWRFYSMPKGKVPLREFFGDRVPMDKRKCPKELRCPKK